MNLRLMNGPSNITKFYRETTYTFSNLATAIKKL